MKKYILVGWLAASVMSCSKSSLHNETNTDVSRTSASVNSVPLGNGIGSYFGVLMNPALDLYSTIPSTNATEHAWEKNTYGVKYVRIAVAHDAWTGTNATTYQTNFLNDYADAINTGLKVLLNVNWENKSIPKTFPSATNYNTFLNDVLGAIKTKAGSNSATKALFKPSLIVVENEETTDGYFVMNTTAQADNYISELTTAASTCKNYTSFDGTGIDVTDGGINARSTTLAAWKWEYSDKPHPNASDVSNANARTTFLYYAATRSMFYSWYPSIAPSDVTTSTGKKADMQNKMNIVTYLLKNFKNIADLSYVNVHWYEPVSTVGWVDNVDCSGKTAYAANQTDPVISPDAVVINKNVSATQTVFDESLADIRNYIGTKKLVTNEIGQYTLSPCLTQSILNMVYPYLGTADFKYVCWYDGDGSRSDYAADALRDDNTDGGRTLRPDGQEFASFMIGPSANCTNFTDKPNPTSKQAGVLK